jgi:hypothetical protein
MQLEEKREERLQKMKQMGKSMLAIVLAATVAISSLPAFAAQTGQAEKDSSAAMFSDSGPNTPDSPLIVTEVVSTGPSKTRYTYTEIYNNSDVTINFKDFHFFYRYPTGGGKDWTTGGQDVFIESGKTLVLWQSDKTVATGKGNTVAEFNQYYGVNLVENKDIFRINYSGIHATDKRGFLFGKDTDSIIAEAWCNENGADLPTGNPDKLGIQYTYAGGTLSRKTSIAKATPGSVDPSQVPAQRVHIANAGVTPTLQNVTASGSVKNEGLTVAASLSLPEGSTTEGLRVNLFYRQKNSSIAYSANYTRVAMQPKEDGTFGASVDRSQLWGSEAEWYVEASYEYGGTSDSDPKTTAIEEPDNISNEKAAPLIITEVSPNPGAGADGSTGQYSYVEVYNRTDKDINLSYYKFFYYYDYPNKTASQSGKIFTVDNPEVMIKSGKTMVLWLSSNGTTVDQFNQHYGTHLVPDQDIVNINYSGLHSSLPRWIRFGTTEQNAFTVAGFNENADQLCDKTSLQYTYPRTEANIAIPVTVSACTPGTLEAWQIPSGLIPFVGYPDYPADDGNPPTLKLSDGWSVPKSINEGDQLYVMYDVDYLAGATDANRIAAIERDQGKPMRPYLIGTAINYQLDGTGTWYRVYQQTQWRLGKFVAQIPSDVLFGHNSVKFNVQAYTLYGSSQTQDAEVKINRLNQVNGVRLNVSDGTVLSGTTTITANDGASNSDTTILVDGKAVSTSPMLENGAYFSVQCSGLDNYFKDALTAPYKDNDRDIITIFSPWCELPTSRAVRVDNKYFTHEDGKYKIKLTMWAGDSGTPFTEVYPEVADENHDDYTVSNVRLRLANGKDYLPVKIEPDNAKTNTATGLTEVHTIGDSAGMVTNMDVYFEIPDTDVNAVGATIDTTQLSDGVHTVTASANGKTVAAKITVDNTPPVIQAGIEENSTQYQPFTLSPKVEDSSKIVQQSVTLDGQETNIPADIVPANLTQGDHMIQITAMDEGNNIATKQVKFVVGSADAGSLTAGQDGITQSSASLFVNVGSAKANVSFLQGKSLTMQNGGITVKSGEAGDTPAFHAENPFVAAGSPEGNFPYERFTVNVGETGTQDEVAVHWKGKASYTDPNHATSLYVLNTLTNQWEQTGVEKDGGIETSFPAKDHTANGKAELLVQCRTNGTMPEVSTAEEEQKPAVSTAADNSGWDGTDVPKNYDFSFAWETDTQYYSESFPYHYDQMNQWIVDNRKKLDIRYVMHTGDLVDDVDMTGEWVNADHSMSIFDKASMPYGVLGGNHDVYAGAEGYGNYWKYFGEDRFKNKPYYGGSYKNNLGHYDLLTENGQDFIILYMSWDIYTNEIEWMNQVLAQYPNRKAIIALHRYTNVKAADNLLDYTGKLLQKEVVAKNKNVIAVLNGHYHGASIQTDSFDDDNDGKPDRTVYQICTDYQSDPEGGSEYIKFLYFDLKNNKIYVNSYSPYRKDFNYFDTPRLASYGVGTKAVDMDIAELDVDFTAQGKTLQTDSLTADLRSSAAIGSGQTGSGTIRQDWARLDSGTSYSWYARAVRDTGEVLYSPMMTFTTVKSSSGGSKSTDKPEASPVKAPPVASSGLSPVSETVVQPGNKLLFTIACEKKPDLVVSGNGLLVSVDAPVTEWDPVTKTITYSLSCVESPLIAGGEVGIYVTIDGVITKIGTVQVNPTRPFTSDTTQDVKLKPGDSYVFKISELQGSGYTFLTGDGRALPTSQVPGSFPAQSGSYLCRVTAKKKGTYGV